MQHWLCPLNEKQKYHKLMPNRWLKIALKWNIISKEERNKCKKEMRDENMPIACNVILKCNCMNCENSVAEAVKLHDSMK